MIFKLIKCSSFFILLTALSINQTKAQEKIEKNETYQSRITMGIGVLNKFRVCPELYIKGKLSAALNLNYYFPEAYRGWKASLGPRFYFTNAMRGVYVEGGYEIGHHTIMTNFKPDFSNFIELPIYYSGTYTKGISKFVQGFTIGLGAVKVKTSSFTSDFSIYYQLYQPFSEKESDKLDKEGTDIKYLMGKWVATGPGSRVGLKLLLGFSIPKRINSNLNTN